MFMQRYELWWLATSHFTHYSLELVLKIAVVFFTVAVIMHFITWTLTHRRLTNMSGKTGCKCLPAMGHEGSLNHLICNRLIWIICYCFCSHQILTQLNNYGRLWTDMLDNTPHQHQNPKLGTLFWKMMFIPPLESRDFENLCILSSALKLCGWHVASQHLTKTFYVGFPSCSYICSNKYQLLSEVW